MACSGRTDRCCRSSPPALRSPPRADRSATAAAQGPVRRVAGAHHLLRLLGAVSPFVSQVNRATGETMRQQATQEGLVPLKAWVKNALDHVIQECMNEPGLEFVWVGDDAVDPLEQAQTLQILVGAGIKTREEARADLGLAPAGGSSSAGLTVPAASADAPARASANPCVSWV